MMFFEKFLSSKILRKVPEITIYFWIIKLLTTAAGESISDFLVHTINPIVAVFIGAIFFLVAILLQFAIRKYIPWVYWFALTTVAIFGTMIADVVHIILGIPYYLSAICLTLLLISTFAMWYKTEKTLSIHSINTRRREIFYWLTVIVTFALGTATGDLTAVTFNLGYLVSGILFGILFLVPFFGRWKFGLKEVVAFWISYIFTRPLGASFADWFGRSPDLGGTGFGTGKTSIVLLILISGFIIYLTITKKDTKKL